MPMRRVENSEKWTAVSQRSIWSSSCTSRCTQKNGFWCKKRAARASRFNVELVNYTSMFALNIVCANVLYSTVSDCIATYKTHTHLHSHHRAFNDTDTFGRSVISVSVRLNPREACLPFSLFSLFLSTCRFAVFSVFLFCFASSVIAFDFRVYYTFCRGKCVCIACFYHLTVARK